MNRPFLDAKARNPIILPDGSIHGGTVHLNQVIDHPNIRIGEHTYYSHFGEVADYSVQIAPYLHEGSFEKLIIGKFCQIAHSVRFITASANHPMGGFSTYPFSIFDPATMGDYAELALQTGDTVVGNDVWFGYGALILPGVTVGDGAIIGAGAVVADDVAPYHIVGGNPARIIRPRFDAATVKQLLAIRWWDWSIEKIGRHRKAIEGADINRLAAADKAG